MASETAIRSPFHVGEQTVQLRAGVRDQAEAIGLRTIRPFMPEQHQAFYQSLPYLLVGHVDKEGQPWASWLSQRASITDSPVMDVQDDRSFDLALNAIHPGDPLRGSLKGETAVGLLGIDLSNRRRNRMSAVLNIKPSNDGGRVSASVRQAFGNCPQYIQTRQVQTRPNWSMNDSTTESFSNFSLEDRSWIEQSDAFFVASYFEDGTTGPETGADVSHRGGQPGFVRVDDELTLTIPDFSGNNHFNTFGNIHSTGKAGLLFVDFDSGDLLMLTGTAEILWDSEEQKHFEGAERLWRFSLKQGVRLKKALGIEFLFQKFSPNSLLSGTWEKAASARAAEQQRQQWLPYRVDSITDEGGSVKSFELVPPAGFEPKFEAGQFLTINVEIAGQAHVRTYTVSSAPSDKRLRLSIKRDGAVSIYLHNQLMANMTIKARPPSGGFVLNHDKPAVFVAAGIGITPMMSMIREGFFRSIKYRVEQPMVLFYQVRDETQLVFQDELKELQSLMGESLRVVKVFSGESALTNVEADHQGYLNRLILRTELALDDYQFYLCGPAGFMQGAYNEIRALGVVDTSISAEAFGPASLTRDVVEQKAVVVETAESAVVEFVPSSVEQGWSPKEGTLLDFAEAHGLAPASGCRAGHCGSCATRVLSGEVVYSQPTTYPVEQGEALLCCAMPAKGMEQETLRLDL
ncbi:MAG: ferredoxin-NADP reductase [Dinoroseobacter sp.]|jgi:ferredoxin-NADP reductase/predicted pyridoxine 5'-phosphate oxidase superfamily flavin-nucleotide-binding protein